VDGVHDLGVIDATQVHGRDPEVGMPELPLDDHQRDALTRHLDRVGMPELMLVPTSAQTSICRHLRYADAFDNDLLSRIHGGDWSA
jgi:hypothetical protein